MRLIQLRWKANPDVAAKPVFINADAVNAVYAMDEHHTMILMHSSPMVVVPIPPAVVVEQLYEGYGETKH